VLDAPKKALAPLAVWIEVQCSGYVSRLQNVGLEAGIRVLEANVPLSEIATGYREAFADKFRALMSDIWGPQRVQRLHARTTDAVVHGQPREGRGGGDAEERRVDF